MRRVCSIVHVCPYCKAWQVDYTMEAVVSYSVWPTPRHMAKKASDIVDDILLDHLIDCFGVPR